MSQSHSGPEDVVSEPPKSVDVTIEPPKSVDVTSEPPKLVKEVSEQKEAIVQPVPEATTADITMDELEVQLDTMDGVVSNAVLELELAQIPARIKATGDADGHLQDLESSIQLRMAVVGALVGAGTLTIQMYMDSVASEMAQARRWALTAKRSGRNDLAVRALQRMKAMQSELSEMKAAMEAS
ncbi:hypothetical protein LPJ69_006561 [Coemansia sp. RSA 1752]|nr:hypothetical protein LPJ69_006561 [Coemansia sp. RSA 1752]KAJ1776385.1 hypothetical protein LPJ67_006425 [Coemansia sp. RSA 1938]